MRFLFCGRGGGVGAGALADGFVCGRHYAWGRKPERPVLKEEGGAAGMPGGVGEGGGW